MLLNIQALRAIAALLVVLVHLEAFGGVLGVDRATFGLGAVGVDLFFVISGFIMVHTTSRRPVSPGGFIANRVMRIAPLYWVLTLGVFVLALARPSLLGSTQADWGALLRSLAFVPYERVDGTIRPILFVGWSLNLEMAFYGIFAAVLCVRDVGTRVALGAVLLMLAVVLGVVLRPYLGPELRFLTQPMLLEFAAGMVIGWLHPHLPASPAMARIAACAGIAALATLVFVARWPLPGGWPISLSPACIVVLAALIAEKGALTLSWRPLQALGDASYALYLIHPFVTQGWAVAATRTGLLASPLAPMLPVGAFICAMFVGLWAHRHLERPLGAMMRRAVAGPTRTAKVRPVAQEGVAP